MLYNSTRLNTLLRKFETKAAAGEVPAMPTLDKVDFARMLIRILF